MIRDRELPTGGASTWPFFIHAYTLVIGQLPAEADLRRFFQVSGPMVHQMVVGLEKADLNSRQPWIAHRIRVRVERALLPDLRAAHKQPVRNSAQKPSHVEPN